MLRHLRRTAFAAAVATLLAGGAHADPQVVKGLIGSPQAGAQVFKQDESFESRELDGGALLRVAPGTEISPLYTTRLVLSGGRKTPTHVFRVGEGRVDVTIPPDKAERVAVLLVGPGGNSAVVHQGRSIVVAKHDAMSFTALDRSMLTGKGSTWKRLTAGGSRVIDLKRGSSEETAALAAPDVGVLQPLRIVLPGEGFQTEVKLHQVEGAERYQVALLKRNGSQLEYVKQVESRGPTLTLSGSEPGHYAVVARALDRFGVPGHVSRPESFRVLSVALPPGSHAEQGSVFVPPNRRVQLVAADGLQMTYGTGAHFVPAPDSVAMSRGTATRVRFRDPKSKQEVSLELLPQMVKARVEVGPKTARWPRDRVHVSVQLVDGKGRPVRISDSLQTNVTINLTPVEVDWKREGSKLEGHIAPPKNLPGPWIVRVEVVHEAAGLVGRDFLEVAQQNEKPVGDRSAK